MPDIKWLGAPGEVGLGQFAARTLTRLTPRRFVSVTRASWTFSAAFLPTQPGAQLTLACGPQSLTFEQAHSQARAILSAVTGFVAGPIPPGCSSEVLGGFRRQWVASQAGAQIVVYAFRYGQYWFTEGPITKGQLVPTVSGGERGDVGQYLRPALRTPLQLMPSRLPQITRAPLPLTPPVVGCATQVSFDDGHRHTIYVPRDIVPPVGALEVFFRTSTDAGHFHSVSLSTSEVTALRAGQTITKRTSRNQRPGGRPHTHSVAINCVAGQVPAQLTY